MRSNTGCVVVLSLAVLAVAGCSGLQANSATAKAIDRDAVLLSASLPTDGNAALDALEYDAGRFCFYHETATASLWSYWFGGGKTIYATAAIYETLAEKADRSAEHLRRYRASTQPAASQPTTAATQPIITEGQPARWRSSHAAWMKTLKREKDGN